MPVISVRDIPSSDGAAACLVVLAGGAGALSLSSKPSRSITFAFGGAGAGAAAAVLRGDEVGSPVFLVAAILGAAER